VIVIPVSSFHIPHFEVTIESLIHVLIRNDPRKENRILSAALFWKRIRFSFKINRITLPTDDILDKLHWTTATDGELTQKLAYLSIVTSGQRV